MVYSNLLKGLIKLNKYLAVRKDLAKRVSKVKRIKKPGKDFILMSKSRALVPSPGRNLVPLGNRSLMPSGDKSLVPLGNRNLTPLGNRALATSGSKSLVPYKSKSSKKAKSGFTKGQKAAAYGAGLAAIVTASLQKPPSGPPTASERQFAAVKKKSPVKKSGFKSPYASDIYRKSASGYHVFKKGSKGARSFQKEYGRAKAGTKFYWPGTGKWYAKP